MANELKEICYLLEGYNEQSWCVLKAERAEDGTWALVVKRAEPEKKPEVADADNK